MIAPQFDFRLPFAYGDRSFGEFANGEWWGVHDEGVPDSRSVGSVPLCTDS